MSIEPCMESLEQRSMHFQHYRCNSYEYVPLASPLNTATLLETSLVFGNATSMIDFHCYVVQLWYIYIYIKCIIYGSARTMVIILNFSFLWRIHYNPLSLSVLDVALLPLALCFWGNHLKKEWRLSFSCETHLSVGC